jgi:hypothetical protein
MARRVKIILNPMADMHNAWRVANDLRPIINDYGGADWSGTVYPTHATALAQQAGEQGYEMVIAMGGDGTVHEVVNGLMQLPEGKRPILGVVPVGSGNDFARHQCPDALGPGPGTCAEQRTAGRGHRLMTDEHGRKSTSTTRSASASTGRHDRVTQAAAAPGFLMYPDGSDPDHHLESRPALMQIQDRRAPSGSSGI